MAMTHKIKVSHIGKRTAYIAAVARYARDRKPKIARRNMFLEKKKTIEVAQRTTRSLMA
jgi:hypothetical protein